MATTTATSAAAASTTTAEAAFGGWLKETLQRGATPTSLSRAATLFASAAAGSTLRQAQNAFMQVVAHLEQHQPGLKDAFFAAVQPALVAKAKAEGNAAAVTDLEAGIVRFVVDIPDAVLAAANAREATQ